MAALHIRGNTGGAVMHCAPSHCIYYSTSTSCTNILPRQNPIFYLSIVSHLLFLLPFKIHVSQKYFHLSILKWGNDNIFHPECRQESFLITLCWMVVVHLIIILVLYQFFWIANNTCMLGVDVSYTYVFNLINYYYGRSWDIKGPVRNKGHMVLWFSGNLLTQKLNK